MAAPINDTEYGTRWDEFLRIIGELGFKVVLSDTYTIEPMYHGDKPSSETLIAAYDEKRGLFIAASSYHGRLSGGHVYGEVEIPADMEWREVHNHLPDYSGGVCTPNGVKPMHIAVDWDVRYSLAGTITQVDASPLKWVKTWTRKDHKRHIWLVDYSQERESGNHADKYNDGGYFDRCRNERAARLPADVREAIGY